MFGPIGVWEQNGASAGCVGPFAEDRTYSRVVVGYMPGAPPQNLAEPPAFLPVELRATTYDLDSHLPDYYDAPLEAVEPTESEMLLGVYTVPPVVLPAGQLACVTTPLSDHWPTGIYHGECRDPRRARRHGLPVDPGWVDLGEAPPNKALTWALLACPSDTTADDGTPIVGAYERDLAYGVRP